MTFGLSVLPVLIVTRPQPQAAQWVARLEVEGVAAVALPLLSIRPAPDAQAVRGVWSRLATFDMVMFVSANAVTQFFALAPCQPAWPQRLRAASTGPGTTAALVAQGVPLAAISAPVGPPFESEALWAQLSVQTWLGQRVLLVRGQGGRDWLQTQWRENGAHVEVLTAYERAAPLWTAGDQAVAAQALAHPQHCVWWLSSADAMEHLPTLPNSQTWALATALASHPRIAARAQALGFGVVHTLPPLLHVVVSWWRARGAALG
jgi:uroporphyrinogen-III synthase